MDKEASSIKDDIIRLTWWMRGGITLSEAYNLTLKERELANALIKENVEAGKKSGIPIY